MLERASLIFHTVRYLKPIQIWSRFLLFFKKSVFHSFIIQKTERSCYSSLPEKKSLYRKPFVETPTNLQERSFAFLNKTVKFDTSILWNDPQQEKLWLYNLHYFDYLLPLTTEITLENFESGKTILLDWIKVNPTGTGNGWEPYPLSLRVVNWIYFYFFYFEFFEKDSLKEPFLKSLYQQSYYLTFFLEFHLLANHLFANIKALIWGGIFFANKKWLAKYIPLLHSELDEQVLVDGGHYERSPMYHSIILVDVLDILNFSRDSVYPLWQSYKMDSVLAQKAEKMLYWLSWMTHPDGKIALFGDSAFGIVPDFEEINKYLKKVLPNIEIKKSISHFQAFKDSGYYVVKNNDYHLTIDAGDLGVDYQPGHAHGDLLSFEFSYKGQRYIVDSGVGNYLNSDLRNEARGVFAHNTAVVNKVDQGQFWSTFRLAKRSRLISASLEEKEDCIYFSGSYENKIDKKKRYIHERIVTFKENEIEIKDRVSGRKISSFKNHIHFHPECRIKLQGNSAAIERESGQIRIISNSMMTEDWSYVEQFGKEWKNKRLILNREDESYNTICFRITF